MAGLAVAVANGDGTIDRAESLTAVCAAKLANELSRLSSDSEGTIESA